MNTCTNVVVFGIKNAPVHSPARIKNLINQNLKIKAFKLTHPTYNNFNKNKVYTTRILDSNFGFK